MPTLDAAYQYQSEGRKEKGIPVLDDNGQVLPEVVKVMEICAEADIIFATGHASSEESITLVRKAHEVGVKRIVITHANSSILDNDTRTNQAVHRPRCLHRVLLPALPLGRRYENAPVPTAKH